MYNKKVWFPNDMQREEIKSLMKHPGWSILLAKAEFDNLQELRLLQSVLQELDTSNPENMLSLEKGSIKADAVELFLSSIEAYTFDNVSSPDDNEN